MRRKGVCELLLAHDDGNAPQKGSLQLQHGVSALEIVSDAGKQVEEEEEEEEDAPRWTPRDPFWLRVQGWSILLLSVFLCISGTYIYVAETFAGVSS